jgi:glycerate 2-kinase
VVDNFQEREKLKNIFISAVGDIAPDRMVMNKVSLINDTLKIENKNYPLKNFQRIRVISVGKAAYQMCVGLHLILGDRVESGLMLSNTSFSGLPEKYSFFNCSHPLPDADNLKAAGRLLEFVGEAGEEDLVICLISGGGSSILSHPAGDITIDEKAIVADKLMLAGANIEQLNIVRKHLSSVKGGHLIKAIAPAKSLALYLSDVPGDDLSTIASGPTVADPTTFQDAVDVLNRFNLYQDIPASVKRHLELGAAGKVPDTLKPGDSEEKLCDNFLVGRNLDFLRFLEKDLSARGYWTLVDPEHYQGLAKDFGRSLALKGKKLAQSLGSDKRPYAYIAGGETTVNVTGDGLGGRNSEVALAAACELLGNDNCFVLAAGTDGKDGPTNAAGAVCDGSSVERAGKLGVDSKQMLLNNDSYNFFEPLGDLVITGPTGTNLMDITILVVL